ncbi:BTB/POZ domain-containing protein 16 isoform X1 [Pantherophis guttatus]|uniref:BTB/POZ domain-containing protein 16 n=2 Tax=Pantherophis guttatus TaxID=94885 RepID=A0A6P9DJ85_PANGU|nr:BTB/POZ domain-containing protein 16 isoform X1 [Pantherophis guttatus]
MAHYKHFYGKRKNHVDLFRISSFVPETTTSDKTACHYLLSAPFVSLGGLSPSEKEIAKISGPMKPRFFRNQAGPTNRWQFPFSSPCDLLGISQSAKAKQDGLHKNLIRIMTVDSPMPWGEEFGGWKTSAELLDESIGQSFSHMRSQIKPKPRTFSRQRLPNQMLFSYTQKITEGMEPDVTLDCLGYEWELHRMYLFKSHVLSQLLAEAEQNSYSPNTRSVLKSRKETRCYKCCLLTGHKPDEFCQQKEKLPKVTIALNITDQDVTRFAFAVALKNMYNSESEVNEEDVLGILAAAEVLQFPSLFQKCIQVMRRSICPTNVCRYYTAGCKYKQPSLITICERWTEVNLVPQLGSQICLRNLPLELLQKVLKSPRLFTINEFYLLRTALYWVFLQQNPKIQIIPSYNTILTYFSSLPKTCAFLEREEGQQYMAIFQSLRLHGITSSRHLEELWEINFFPLPWLTRILSDHYHALENGGDMAFQADFNTQAVRFGLMLREEPRYHAEVISIYGFFFELKAVKHDASAYSFYMKRVRHADPIISYFTAERSPVNLQKEREVKYEIKAQCQIDGKWQEFTTERLTQSFGVKKSSSKSKILKARIPSVPIYVTFLLLFPSS